MSDIIITSTADNNSLTLVYVDMLEACKEALEIHKPKGLAAQLFCEALVGGTLISHSLKEETDSLLMILRGDGPIGGITVRSEKKGQIKGYLYNSQAEAESVATLLGSGIFSLIKDLGLRGTYTGNLPLLTGNIEENITAYYAESEQIATSCGIGVDFDDEGNLIAAAGFLLQLLPDTPYEIVDRLQRDLGRHVLPAELSLKYKTDYPKILSEILPSFSIHILEETPVHWICGCTKSRMEEALISIGKDELEAIVGDGEDIEVVCDYCQKKYSFTPDEIELLYKQAKK